MKRIFLLFTIVVLSALCTYSQDIIYCADGSEIKVEIKEVSETTIKYVRVDNPTGPLYTINKDNVLLILYANGTKDIFSKTSETEQPVEKHVAVVHGYEKLHTAAEGPWLLYGVKLKEGFNVYVSPETSTMKEISGLRYLPSIEGYVEFAPKQEDMALSRSAAYLGLQYTFRGGKMNHGATGQPLVDLQYLCLRPAYSIELQSFYSHTGMELAILTNAKYYTNGTKSNAYGDCNKATFGIWEELGFVIKDHFNIGFAFDWVISNSTKHLWGYYDNGNWVSPKRYSPQLQFQIVLGWRFDPYKFDKKKVEHISLKDMESNRE